MTAIFKARYYKADGKKGRARTLPAPLFNGIVNEGVVHQAVKAYLAVASLGGRKAQAVPERERSDLRSGRAVASRSHPYRILGANDSPRRLKRWLGIQPSMTGQRMTE